MEAVAFYNYSIEPDPVQSNDKWQNIASFNAAEGRRENLHKNDPTSTKILHISVVVLVVVIAFLIFFKICWDSEKVARKNPQWANEQLARREAMPTHKAKLYRPYQRSQSSAELYSNTRLLEINNHRRGSMPNNGLKVCASKPACFCALTDSGGKSHRQKGWKRNKDYEPYGPQNV